MVLSCAAEYTALPQRLAGTASQYSTKAIPQLASTTVGSGLSLNFRWPYQAKVMKTLEANSIRIGSSVGETVGIDVLLQDVVRLNRRPRTPFLNSILFDFKNTKARRIGATLS